MNNVTLITVNEYNGSMVVYFAKEYSLPMDYLKELLTVFCTYVSFVNTLYVSIPSTMRNQK